MAQQFQQEYKESISPFSISENNLLKRVTQAHPAKIYVPTAAAHHNLDLIKGLSPATTWKNAPASIRQPPQKKTKSIYQHQKQTSMPNETFKFFQQAYITTQQAL